MKARILVWLVALFCCHNASFAQKEFVNASARLSGHPRILLQKGEEKALKKVIMKDAVWKDIHQSLVDEAGEIVKLPLNERIKTGRRLLSVSRENLRRIFILSYAYRMTGKNEFLKRAESEMLKAASFSDWNPSHFLDVGEMTMALAIGYDWLYPQLSVQTKKEIENAIVEKGLKPSFDERYNWFVNAVHNWSQVCHAGVTYGALAIWEKEPELSRTVINRAIDKISIPMGHYAPDGAYPEGIGYWDYGTSFNAMFLSAIEKVFGTDYGLSELPSNAVVTYRKAAKAVIEKDGKLLLIYTNQGDYKFPGGGYKNSENAAECIVREMLEETGYQVEKVGKLFGIVLEQKVDDFERLITMQDGTKIPMDDVLSIDGELFSSLE